jgi:peptide deformylase
VVFPYFFRTFTAPAPLGYHTGMSVQPVLRMGDPVLRRVAAPVERFDTPELKRLIADMTDTMNACDGAGLAAIQIGVLQRVVIFGVEHNPRYPDAVPVPFTVLINPVITPLDEEREEDWEGCLSVPGMRGLVPRYRRIHYRGFDPSGNAIDRDVEGFHARVVQHECDHLDGILYPERIADLRKFGFIEELQQAGLFADRILPAEETAG